MADKKKRYHDMERYITIALVLDTVFFILYLIFAGSGVIWAKVTFAIITILLSGLILGYLYMTKELLRRRSLWMTTAAAAIAICVVFSMILNFPSPKYQLPESSGTGITTGTPSET